MTARIAVRRCSICGKNENQVAFHPRGCKTSQCIECNRAYQRAKYWANRPAPAVAVTPGMLPEAAAYVDELTQGWGAGAPREWWSMVR